MSKQESFPVLSIDREDINHAIGYALGPELSDKQMRTIASGFNDALMVASEPWDILADVVDSIVVVDTGPYVITIEVESGVVRTVRGLPEGYDYEIIDHDVIEPVYPEYTKESEQ